MTFTLSTMWRCGGQKQVTCVSSDQISDRGGRAVHKRNFHTAL